MIAEVISIGDELTSGQRLDTNSQWLSERLGELGIRVLYHTTVADDLQANVQVIRQAAERADVVIMTGGLGPTADDLTRQAIAEMTGTELELDEAQLEYIRGLFARRQRPMPQKNVVQAMFPAGSEPIANPNGTAPGIDMRISRPGRTASRIFALPGVPAEMKQMWQASVALALSEQAGRMQQVIRHRRIKCFGVGESDLEQMLPDLVRRGRSPSVGITVSQATITLRITASDETAEACYAAMQPTLKVIHDSLGTIVFGDEDDELEHVVARLLSEREQTLATAEWGTSGLLSHWLSEVPEASAVYQGGLVIASRKMLRQALDITSDSAARHDGSSRDVVAAMASNCRQQYKTQYVLAVGVFANHEDGEDQAGRCYYALASAEEVLVKSSLAIGHPEIHKPRAAKQALNLLRLTLLGQSNQKPTPPDANKS